MHASKRSPVTAPAVLRNPKNSLDPLCFIFFRGETCSRESWETVRGRPLCPPRISLFCSSSYSEAISRRRCASRSIRRCANAGILSVRRVLRPMHIGKARTKWPSNPDRVTRPSHSGLRHRSPCAGNLELQRFSSAWAFLVPWWLHAFRSYIGFVSPRGQLRYYGIRGCLTTKRNYIQRRSQKGVYVAKFGATIAVATVTGF